MNKVCFFLTDASDEGGIQRVISELANKFSDEREVWIISIFCNDKNDIKALPYEIRDNVKFKSFINKNNVKNKFIKKIKLVLAIFRLYAFLKRAKFDVLIANGMESVIWSFIPAALLNFKYICCDHTSYDRKPLWARVGRKLSLIFAHSIVVLTSSDARAWNHEKVSVIPNPSPYRNNLLITPYNGRSMRIIAVGRLVPVKGFDRLLSIWEKFISSHPSTPYHLEIIGNGPLKDELNSKVETSGVERITIREFNSKIEDIYNDSQLILMTSYHEGLAMVLIEAQAFGIPAVAFDVSGPSEVIINGQTGFLIENGNEDAFISKLSLLLNDDVLRYTLSKNCSKYLYRFDIDGIVEKWVRLFEA